MLNGECLVRTCVRLSDVTVMVFTGDEVESHDCAVCGTRVEHPSLSRPLNKSNCSLYDMTESQLSADMRVCNNCRCKSIHKRYMQSV